MTLFHNLGIGDPQGSAEPNNKDACFLLQVNTPGYKYELPFCLPLCASDWDRRNWPEKQPRLHPLWFNPTNEIISALKKLPSLGVTNQRTSCLILHAVKLNRFQAADQIRTWILTWSQLSGPHGEKKKKPHKSMLLIPALWHRPQKPQKRQLSIQPWTFNRNLSKLHWWKEIMIGKGFCWDRLSSSTKLVLPAESESHPLIIHYRSKLGWLQNLKHPLCSMCSAFVCLLVDHTKEKSGLCMN